MRIHVLALLATVLLPAPLLADTFTYTYTGNPLQGNAPGFSATDDISGSFTLASPLAANQLLTEIVPVSFDFSDGVNTFTSGETYSSIGFAVGTGPSGQIDAWGILLNQSAQGLETDNLPASNIVEDMGSVLVQSGRNMTLFSQTNNADPGRWTESTTTDPAATPEPASLLLTATGLLGAAATIRRRICRI
jgi:hypothetical protein